ncbi:PIN domain-containing protein [Thomasclavelia ramosa]|uniref:PIN domain-containing protein n=1 Tax=Thomasclavelia ramosa TaxID=1547 RepID=UPI001D06D975|nr:PIN domain-containing protein [Thomasclavelia ramosa]MCB6435872.1 PIN domain-containing protein [Thomasclavelia ramosa]MCB6458921.1 PIN domain-containing protein [Thomasclavelia ramosa]MCB6597099.1 PIN domain-containing protein [Thomasclavelia ramosa]MCB6600642.1 PIN domain-containing protein [Thomasclavelia ramosa]MCB6618679.1 PIN domain-containing protein [Thomasclavelia ramosa]
MKLNDETTYYLIFDTNALFQSYDKKADFTSFSFNSTYSNVIDMINQLDIYNQVVLAIPSVVWSEMEKQIIEKHDELIVSYKSTITKKLFPEFSILENKIEDYPTYIRNQIKIYKTELSNGLNRVIELPLATSNRFESIIDRAFNKNPPFEGKSKKSDKGFKDALLWESILEFTFNHLNSKILYYSKDNAFDEFLLKEFSEYKIEASLSICKNEIDVKTQLEIWAKEIDKYSYQPIEDFVENKEIVDWLQSGDFLIQMVDKDFGIVEKGRLISSTSMDIISFDNIECLYRNEEISEYSIEVVLSVNYVLKDGWKTSEIIDTNIRIKVADENVFSVENVYRIDDSESEN